MTKILNKESIKNIINKSAHSELITYMEKAFVAYSTNKAVVPPVGTLRFSEPPGDMHIKYGYIKDDDNYVVKIASGFYNNPALGLSSSNGLNLVFNQKTGELETILLDEGYLTNIRTALAGAVVAKYMAQKNIKAIGIIGSGIQARLQLRYLKSIVSCKRVFVWGTNSTHVEMFQKDMRQEDFDVEIAGQTSEVAHRCNLIITTTPSESALLFARDIQKGTHITAVGADTLGKQELDTSILEKATMIAVDSLLQCKEHGEIHKAINLGLLNNHDIVEIGNIIVSGGIQRSDADITVADLTGIATQDILISNFILNKHPTKT